MSNKFSGVVDAFNDLHGTNYRLGSISRDNRTLYYIESRLMAGVMPAGPDDVMERKVEIACQTLLQREQLGPRALATLESVVEKATGKVLQYNAVQVMARQLAAYHQIVAAMRGYEDPTDSHDAIAAIIEDEESRREDLI